MTLESALASIWVNTYAYTPPNNDLEGTIFGPPALTSPNAETFESLLSGFRFRDNSEPQQNTPDVNFSMGLALKNLIHQCIHPTTHLDEYALGQVERTLMNVGDAQVSEEPLPLVVVTQLVRTNSSEFRVEWVSFSHTVLSYQPWSLCDFASESRHFDGA